MRKRTNSVGQVGRRVVYDEQINHVDAAQLNQNLNENLLAFEQGQRWTRANEKDKLHREKLAVLMSKECSKPDGIFAKSCLAASGRLQSQWSERASTAMEEFSKALSVDRHKRMKEEMNLQWPTVRFVMRIDDSIPVDMQLETHGGEATLQTAGLGMMKAADKLAAIMDTLKFKKAGSSLAHTIMLKEDMAAAERKKKGAARFADESESDEDEEHEEDGDHREDVVQKRSTRSTGSRVSRSSLKSHTGFFDDASDVSDNSNSPEASAAYQEPMDLSESIAKFDDWLDRRVLPQKQGHTQTRFR